MTGRAPAAASHIAFCRQVSGVSRRSSGRPKKTTEEPECAVGAYKSRYKVVAE